MFLEDSLRIHLAEEQLEVGRFYVVVLQRSMAQGSCLYPGHAVCKVAIQQRSYAAGMWCRGGQGCPLLLGFLVPRFAKPMPHILFDVVVGTMLEIDTLRQLVF